MAEWEVHGRINSFPLGEQDVSDRLLIPEKLYGRERESAALLAAFERVVADGAPEFVLVSGYAGMGKSPIVHELHRALVPPRGLFASGKFDQYKRDIPYATLAQAFQSLVRSILSQSEVGLSGFSSKSLNKKVTHTPLNKTPMSGRMFKNIVERPLSQWRDAFQQAVGPNGQLMVNLLPELELIIGKQPPVADLPPQDAQHRFQLVFRRFLGVFARPDHPLTLFLDDLQWLDAATLHLLEHLVTEPEVRYLLLIGAYRDNEVSPSHPLRRTLDAIRTADARVHDIVLTPLGLDHVASLLADALHWEREHAQPLAELVHEKTAGNPFFAIQFVAALAEERLLAFDPDSMFWTCDLGRIRAKGYTDNVIDFLIGKLNRLPARMQEALEWRPALILGCLYNTRNQ